MKQTAQPVTKALPATAIISFLLPGAIVLNAPIKIPRELGFANPQRQYVAMTSPLVYKKTNKMTKEMWKIKNKTQSINYR